MYSITLSLPSTVNGVGGQRHTPAILPEGNTRYQLYRKLCGPPKPLWTGAENSPPTEIRSPNRPARSKSLCRLSYLGHNLKGNT